MVDPDLGIAIPQEQPPGGIKKRQPLLRRRQCLRRDHLLPLGHPWHMCIAIERHTIRRQRQQFLHALRHPLTVLVRQAKEDVGVQAFDPGGAYHLDRITRGIIALNAADDFLDLVIEILHADRRPVHAVFGKNGNAFLVDLVRVDFNGEFRTFRKRCNIKDRLGQLAHHVGREQRWRPAPPVQARQTHPGRQNLAEQSQFLFQRLKIDSHRIQFLRALGAAGAEPAQSPAKRDVNIERNGRAGANGPDPVGEISGSRVGAKMRRGRVAGVTRHAGVKKTQPLEARIGYHTRQIDVI